MDCETYFRGNVGLLPLAVPGSLRINGSKGNPDAA
jgi:hypothetical protein